jgi:molecular chaperone GrpE (heat shock protein)
MARGWESKVVEGQIEARKAEKDVRKLRPTTAQLDMLRKKEDLMLSRKRVLHDIEAAHNPRYKEILNAALAHLDQELARL